MVGKGKIAYYEQFLLITQCFPTVISNILYCRHVTNGLFEKELSFNNGAGYFEVSLAVFILGRAIAGIPHFRKKSPKLSDTVRDKSPTLNHIAIIFKIRLIFHPLGSKGLKKKQKKNAYRKENFLVLYFS